MATVLGCEIVLPADGDFGAALGAARLGLCAATGADPLAVMLEPPVQRRFEPTASLAAAVEDSYGHYRALYPAIRNA
jgi:xylulokinase